MNENQVDIYMLLLMTGRNEEAEEFARKCEKKDKEHPQHIEYCKKCPEYASCQRNCINCVFHGKCQQEEQK